MLNISLTDEDGGLLSGPLFRYIKYAHDYKIITKEEYDLVRLYKIFPSVIVENRNNLSDSDKENQTNLIMIAFNNNLITSNDVINYDNGIMPKFINTLVSNDEILRKNRLTDDLIKELYKKNKSDNENKHVETRNFIINENEKKLNEFSNSLVDNVSKTVINNLKTELNKIISDSLVDSIVKKVSENVNTYTQSALNDTLTPFLNRLIQDNNAESAEIVVDNVQQQTNDQNQVVSENQEEPTINQVEEETDANLANIDERIINGQLTSQSVNAIFQRLMQ